MGAGGGGHIIQSETVAGGFKDCILYQGQLQRLDLMLSLDMNSHKDS